MTSIETDCNEGICRPIGCLIAQKERIKPLEQRVINSEMEANFANSIRQIACRSNYLVNIP